MCFYLQIQSTKTVGGVDVADKVHLQLLSTDESKPREARVARQTTKNGLYNALDIGSIWLQKAKRETAEPKREPQAAERDCSGMERPLFAVQIFCVMRSFVVYLS